MAPTEQVAGFNIIWEDTFDDGETHPNAPNVLLFALIHRLGLAAKGAPPDSNTWSIMYLFSM